MLQARSIIFALPHPLLANTNRDLNFFRGRPTPNANLALKNEPLLHDQNLPEPGIIAKPPFVLTAGGAPVTSCSSSLFRCLLARLQRRRGHRRHHTFFDLRSPPSAAESPRQSLLGHSSNVFARESPPCLLLNACLGQLYVIDSSCCNRALRLIRGRLRRSSPPSNSRLKAK
jgi:hypothetical protein